MEDTETRALEKKNQSTDLMVSQDPLPTSSPWKNLELREKIGIGVGQKQSFPLGLPVAGSGSLLLAVSSSPRGQALLSFW